MVFDNCYVTVGGLQEWSYMRYPPWAHGPGYVISRDVAKFVVEGHQKQLLKVTLTNFFLQLVWFNLSVWGEQYVSSGLGISYLEPSYRL
jgi:beta-1,3-galactosyltransferase